MKYSDEDALKEILSRRNTVIRRRRSRSMVSLAAVSMALFATLLILLSAVPAGTVSTVSGGTIYGSFLLGRAAGGYVLASVVAFLLGITVTLFCIKYREQRFDNEKDKGTGGE